MIPRSSFISTHAPLAGRDELYEGLNNQGLEFQPTRPLRGATLNLVLEKGDKGISTHAPLAGRDRRREDRELRRADISTHAPLAGRDVADDECVIRYEIISTHAPLAGRDLHAYQTRP